MTTKNNQLFGHPKGLFYLFFAEMWKDFRFIDDFTYSLLIKDYYSHLENNENSLWYIRSICEPLFI